MGWLRAPASPNLTRTKRRPVFVEQREVRELRSLRAAAGNDAFTAGAQDPGVDGICGKVDLDDQVDTLAAGDLPNLLGIISRR